MRRKETTVRLPNRDSREPPLLASGAGDGRVERPRDAVSE
jgi:hypothetical protein